MRILIVTESLATGTAGAQISRGTAKVLELAGHEVAFLSPEPWPENDAMRSSFHVYHIPTSTPFIYFYDLIQARYAVVALQKFKPDVVHAVVLGNVGGISYVVLQAILNFGVPVVYAPVSYIPICMNTYFYRSEIGECNLCEGHRYRWGMRYRCGGRLGSFTQWLALHLQKTTLKRINVWLSPNQIFDKGLLAYGVPIKKILLTYHPFDWDRLEGLQVKHGDYFVFNAQGRMEKGIHLFPEIFARVPGSHFELFLAGVKWPYINRLQSSPNVKSIRIGLRWETGVGAAVAGSRAVVLPTSNQGFSDLAVYEGMALGKPVITFNVGGNPQLLRHQRDGWLAEPGDIGGLANAVRLLKDNPHLALEMGDSARQQAAALFGRESIYAIYQQAYEMALKGC